MFEGLLEIIRTASPIEAFLVGVVLIVGMYQGFIKAPKWLKLKRKQKKDPDSNINNFPSLKLLVKLAIEKAVMIHDIVINKCLSEQMNFADDLFVDIRDILKRNYLKMYKELRGGNKAGLMQEKDVLHYIAILNNAEPLLKGLTRRIMKKNHFLEKSDEEFRLYISEKLENYQQALSGFLDEQYNSDKFEISRENLFDENIKNCMPEIAIKVERFFYRIRTIAQEKADEIKALETEIKDFV